MAHEEKKEHKETKEEKETIIKSDPETLDTTDPQEHMEGPISSLMKKVGGSFDDEKAPKEISEKEEEEKE